MQRPEWRPWWHSGRPTNREKALLSSTSENCKGEGIRQGTAIDFLRSQGRIGADFFCLMIMASSIMKLPRDMISLIAEHVTDPKDFVNARAVCRDWKSVFTTENYSLLSHGWRSVFKDRISRGEMPWLILAEREDSDVRSFFSPSTLEVYDLPFPELWHMKIAGSAYGWLVRMGEDKEIDLFNPLTREQRKLPPQPTFGYDTSGWSAMEIRDRFLAKVILTSSPSKEDCMAIAIYPLTRTMGAVARPGDEVWTTVGGESDWRMFQDFINYKGIIYTIDIHGWFGMFDLSSEPKGIKLGRMPALSRDEDRWNYWDRYNKYLVEVLGDLLVIVRRYYSANDTPELLYDDEFMLPEVVIQYRTLLFKVYKLNQLEPEVEWVELKDLGDYSVFVGQHNLCLGGHDQGIYSLEDGSIQLYYEDFDSVSPHIRYLGKQNQALQINHYPPCPNLDLTLALGAHTDPNCLTVVQHDQVSGLQIIEDGSWFDVPALPGAFFVNIRDQLQVISNGEYKTLVHTAVTNYKRRRVLIPSFYGPSLDALIRPAPLLAAATLGVLCTTPSLISSSLITSTLRGSLQTLWSSALRSQAPKGRNE
ncbi:hypothetical protein H6P81_017496 [Aristolochia fimbriata]|uniref:Fe2OG dioxygenase domain-containing protein n=1 Tax=Aristolochia fimbriata TaxID=158543 RepID=A0AAV7E2M5_ARIFI|nr:hypothetical protein H6P81_017496 [Aristolochia fimbriata]